MSAPEPVEVEVVKGGDLRISWDDGHQSLYPVRYLRGYCPCAECQGHGGGYGFVANDAPRISGIDEVGNYALNIRYGPHRTGIYTFELLRTLCPCESCRREQGDRHPYARMPPEGTVPAGRP